MTILFAANEVDAFTTISNTSFITLDVDALHHDSDFAVNGAIQLVNSANLKADFTGQTEGWLHLKWAKEVDDNSQDNDVIILNDASVGVPVLWLDMDNGDFKFTYRNGGGFTVIGAIVPVLHDQLYSIDIYWNLHASTGEFSFYLDGALQRQLTGNTLVGTSVVDVDQVEFRALIPGGSGTNSENIISEIIVATTSTIAMRVATISPTGAGTTAGFSSGAYTDIDDVVIADDTNFIASDTANQVDTYAASNLSVAAALLEPLAVVSCARAQNAATGPQNVQHATRVNSVDYFSASVSGINTAFQGFVDVQEVSPDTAIAWTTTEIDALEIGVKSIT